MENRKRDAFYPGMVWTDTNGKRIQAHGGSVLYRDGVYYWYGENKEQTNGENGIWHWGVRCYSSRDLYNWEDMGLILLPDLMDETAVLSPYQMMDRPHILWNEKTRLFVCRVKIMERNGEQTQAVFTGEDLNGPYRMVRQGVRPCGKSAGDFDLAVDENGKAYMYFEEVHSRMIVAELTEDYLDVTDCYSEHFEQSSPPYVREAPAHFFRNRKHYLITSGTTGYLPNPSEAAAAENWHGPYKVLGNVHPEDRSLTSFHSQISCVFPVQGKKDLFIACADRWVPDHMEYSYWEYAKAYGELFEGCSEQEKKLAIQKIQRFGDDRRRNTSIADYVWLPIKFEEEQPVIHWRDKWQIEEYD